ncbi:MAG: hypothetical protein K9J13_03410 [Saprospiraceae bacterium]|nr:hypothetical protein [Saprospiraceae bacterium]
MKHKILILLCAVLIFGCSDNEDLMQNNKSVCRVSQATVYNLLLCPNDPDEEARNMIQYDWGIEARTVMSNSNDYATILAALIADNDHTMLFDDLGINTAITELTGADSVVYEPYLWLYNADLDNFNEEYEPFLCIGEDIDIDLADSDFYTNDDDQDMDDEFIPGWNFATSFGNEVINETEANDMEEPLFIVIFAEKDVDLGNSNPVGKEGNIDHPVDPEAGQVRYWSKSYQIHKRFENCGRSEVCFNYRMEINNDLKTMMHSKKYKIHKKYLNQWRDVSRPLYWSEYNYNLGLWVDQPIASTDIVNMYGVVYEHDWFRTPKMKILQDPYGNTAEIKYRAKYQSDFYQTFSGDWTLMVLGHMYGGGINPGIKYIKDL